MENQLLVTKSPLCRINLSDSVTGRGKTSRNQTMKNSVKCPTTPQLFKRDDMRKRQNFFYQTLKNQDHSFIPTCQNISANLLHATCPLSKKFKKVQNPKISMMQSMVNGMILKDKLQRPVTSQNRKRFYLSTEPDHIQSKIQTFQSKRLSVKMNKSKGQYVPVMAYWKQKNHQKKQ